MGDATYADTPARPGNVTIVGRPDPDHPTLLDAPRLDDPAQADAPTRSDRWLAASGDLLLALLLAGLTVYISLRNGGFFPGTASLAAAEVAICIAVVLVIARRPWHGLSVPFVIGAVAIGGLAAWTLASSDWSGTPARAIIEYTRVLLYGLTFVLFGLLAFSVRRIRWMLYAMAAASVAVCTVALIARTLPEVIYWQGLADEDRLGYPLGYWNGLALLAGVGIVFCGHLACSVRDARVARVLGAAAVPLVTAALYYTSSRGGTWATVGGVVVYVVVARPRALLSGAIATVPPTFAMLLALNPPNALTDPEWAVNPGIVEAGQEAALAIALAVVAAAALRMVMLPADTLVKNLRLPDRVRRPAMATATVGVLAVVLAGAAALNVPDVVSGKVAEFQSEDDDLADQSGARLLSARNNGRQEHWDVAMAAFRRDRLHGSGAGMYGIDWARDRQDSVFVQDGHSFYVELLGELGWPGLALGAGALLMALLAFAYRARGPDRALFAALLAAGLAWAAQASVDWLWELPAVTLWLFAFGGAVLARSRRSGGSLPAWTIAVRVAGVALCIALAVLPMRVSVSQARIDRGLDALDQGDCSAARADAQRALDVLPERALPYQLIAYCDMGQNRDRAAVRALRQAVRRDPRNWELHHSLAVARARAGLDPRREARRAASLNPRGELTQAALELFLGRKSRGWKRAGEEARVTPPAPPSP